MIQSNELRIGNWVAINGREDFPHMKISTGGQLDYCSHYNPIPLTPEILKKAGFEWSVYHQSFWNKSFGYKANWWSVGQGVDVLLTLEKRINIKYLHQLQNLYFAITGEELEINF